MFSNSLRKNDVGARVESFVRCFCVSRLDALFLKSTVRTPGRFTLAIRFFYLLYTETWQV